MKVTENALARSPLGIISLFVFFIEAIATVSLGIAVKTQYVSHVVWFIILFPTLIVFLFFITLWTKRECLYSPMEFRDDRSFLNLLNKVDRLEIKQRASEIDLATTELPEVYATLDRLIKLNDIYGAVQVGRAYLKQQRYEESVEIFSYLKNKANIKSEVYFKVLSNLAYSLIGKEKYLDAIKNLTEVEKLRGKDFRSWHSIAMAYSYFKLGDNTNFEKWIASSKARPEYRRNTALFKSLYPEISAMI